MLAGCTDARESAGLTRKRQEVVRAYSLARGIARDDILTQALARITSAPSRGATFPNR